MSDPIKCSCGSQLFYRAYPARGVWTQTVDTVSGSVVVIDSHTDGIRSSREPKTMKCTDCGKRIPNPDFDVTLGKTVEELAQKLGKP